MTESLNRPAIVEDPGGISIRAFCKRRLLCCSRLTVLVFVAETVETIALTSLFSADVYGFELTGERCAMRTTAETRRSDPDIADGRDAKHLGLRLRPACLMPP